VYSTGTVKAGKRETKVRIHAVVDFRDAPPPGVPPELAAATGLLPGAGEEASGGSPAGGTTPPANLPEGATEAAIAAAFAPSPGGNILYYRVD
jgi:hypothetical protein